MAFDLITTAILSLLIVARWKERTLYVIFPWAYVQNFVLAWAYTSGWLGKGLCQALVISKEFLLLWLFLYFLLRLPPYGERRWPAPLRVLALFTAWCVMRYAIAVAFQGQGFFANLFTLRMACFPFEILVVAVGVVSARPKFARRFIRNMVLLIVALAAVGIALDVLPGTNFWRDHVNFASYRTEVKGESTAGYEGEAQEIEAESEGLYGNGVARTAFTFLSPFRAVGTVGDSVGFGHFVAFPLLLLAFYLRRNWKTSVMAALTAAALFLSFTRSAWIFVAIGFFYVLLRKKRYRLAFGLAGTGLVALTAWAPLATLFSGTLVNASSSSTDPHAQGLFWFYTQGLWQSKYLLGQGMTADLPESGYGILLIRYGLPAIVILVWFCFALYRSLRKTALREAPLLQIAQAVPIGIIVIMNFSYYPFSFIPYLLVWFVIGACLALSSSVRAGSIAETHHLMPNTAEP